MKTKHSIKSLISGMLAVIMTIGAIPSMSVFAAQVNEYIDPADVWITSNGRTNELDFNATITQETLWCPVCNKDTIMLTYRTPEYTKSGTTALNRGVAYSDGTMTDGVTKGNIDDGRPGIDATYTTYHWTKSICQVCGTINSADGFDSYCFSRNVYSLNSCDHDFFLDFDNTTYEPYNDTYHTTVLKRGQYCQFCKGTKARATEKREAHNFIEVIDAQLGNNRFYVSERCDDCGYETNEYITAKSVVSSYYGTVDGAPHTVSVSDLSEGDVHTSIRYGTSANSCTLTSAPNYTEAGYYPVYYEIDYKYDGKSMTENGVSYVWLLEDENDTIIILPPTNSNEEHSHDYRYVETIKPSCENLGYEHWQCDGCGRLEKRNYTQATGHNYKPITIREATCKQGGLKLWLCSDCGDFYEETTSLAAHSYKTVKHNPTCRMTGYTEHICEVCGDNYITDITPIISHAYEHITKEPTCTEKGYTTHTCTMCDYHYVSDYTEPTDHKWDEGHTVTNSTCDAEGVMEYHCMNCNKSMIKAISSKGHTYGDDPTCTEPQRCTECGVILRMPAGHHYTETITEPTCTAMGYTTYTCEDCGASYIGDYTNKEMHNYTKSVIYPTCTELGYTTYTCTECGDSYKSDYKDKKEHNYDTVITYPTCITMGYTTYTCTNCGDSYVGDYTDMLEHNYNKETVEPTCTEHGYAVYTCPDCGKSYIGDYTDCKEHHYVETVIAPTCTEMGYSIFKCDDCGDEYKGNYTDKVPHDYEKNVTEPTCTSIGYTTYTCKNCNDRYVSDYTDKAAHSYEETVTEPTCLELGFSTFVCSVCGDTYKSNYREALGHQPTEWIVDTEATIEHSGEKHIECERCGEILQTAEIPQLIDKDNSDEDGNAQVGNFSIILTDKDGKPVFDSEISIDVNDNVTIKLPEGRLLDFADRTIITAFFTDTQEPADDLRIFIYDTNNNAATGATDENGQLVVPNNQSSTGDNNGTIGNEDGDKKNTFVVTVTDKTNVVIPNCDIHIGESNNIVVDLPDGIKPTRENPVIVTVTDHNGEAQKDITVIAIGDADFMEKGSTDMYGKITLPTASDGYTDEKGKVNVDNINVIVNDEIGVISNAYVIHNEDGTINVTLPDEKTISYANRITITVLDSIGKPVAEVNVTVNDIAEKSYTANTDESGTIVVPPLSEDMTDSEGKAFVNGYNILLSDEQKVIENAFVYIKDNKIYVELPEGAVFDYNNRITATVTDKDNNPVKDMSVTFTDSTEKTETNLTDENGRATVPPVNIDYTDVNGYSEVDGYIVTVVNETGAIEKAFVTHTEDNKITVELPDNVKFDYANRITVTVYNKADKTAVKDMNVTVSEKSVVTEDTGEAADVKSLNGVTNNDGKAVFPPLSEDVTDDNGSSNITEEKPGKGEDTDGDGVEDKPGEIETVTYKVSVNDTKGIINNAFVEIKDGKVYVTLPDTHTLTTSNQTTVTVLDKDGNAVKGVSVTIKDKTTEKTATTDANGKVTLPVKTSSGGGSSSGGSSGGGGGSYISANTTNVRVTDKDSKTVNVTKTTDKDGNVTLTLPTGKTLDSGNFYTVITTDKTGKAKADVSVTLKDKSGKVANGTTDKNGTLILPAIKHSAYIVGYDDGTFKPDSDMSRAEAAAIFARLIAEAKGETVSGKSSFADVSSKEWYSSYIGYLEKYNVISGYNDGTFKPDASVTRAEFVSMAVRYYGLFNEVKTVANTTKYTDVDSSYWAIKDISYAKSIGWLNGYADGTFKGDNNITRAEVVTVVNRATNRTADKEYINANLTKLNQFTDLKTNTHWAWYDILEAANEHLGIVHADGETWVK